MATTGIRVTPEQLQQISAQLDAGASSIEGTLRQLAGNVAPLGSDWAGVAQARFLELWADWQRSGATLHQALTGIARLTATPPSPPKSPQPIATRPVVPRPRAPGGGGVGGGGWPFPMPSCIAIP